MPFLAQGGALEATQLMQCCHSRSDCWHKKRLLVYKVLTLNVALIQPAYHLQHAYIHQDKGRNNSDDNNPFFLFSLHIL